MQVAFYGSDRNEKTLGDLLVAGAFAQMTQNFDFSPTERSEQIGGPRPYHGRDSIDQSTLPATPLVTTPWGIPVMARHDRDDVMPARD